MVLIRTYSCVGEGFKIGEYLSFPYKNAQYDLCIGESIIAWYGALVDYSINDWRLNEINSNV